MTGESSQDTPNDQHASSKFTRFPPATVVSLTFFVNSSINFQPVGSRNIS